MQLSRKSGGFTIIELMLVILIVCILGALVALTASGVQARNRNGDRQKDIDALRMQLESYYAGHDKYPTSDNLSDAAWRSVNTPRLQNGLIDDPRWDIGVTACTRDSKPVFASHPASNCYSYQVTASDGSVCNNAKTPCAHYTLTAVLEGGENYVKSSLN